MFASTALKWAGGFALLIGLAMASPLRAAEKDADKDDAAKATSVSLVGMTLEDKAAAVDRILQGKTSKDGANTCLECHDEDAKFPVLPMFKTKHAVKADPRTPFGQDNGQCESCHGPGNNHAKAKKKDKRSGNIINFGKDTWTPVKEQNEKCLTCHQNHQRIQWQGSSHEFNDVSCASCHKIHMAKDSVLNRQSQADVCYTCHANERAKFQQASHHPVREGKMACSECHNVHGENGSGLMVKASAREKCASCHAEKRGPFLWEHAPAAEDCALCHSPHGSNQPALLKKRPPQLCQECHSPLAAHPTVAYDGTKLPNSAFLGAKGCLNCHSAVHGSNHPSGVTQLR